MGCTTGVVKCILNTLNALWGIAGLTLIALATLQLSTAPLVYIYYLYIVGGVIFVAALLGCCGICQEHVCLTTTYAIIILGTLILQLVGTFFVTNSEAIEKFATDDVKFTWEMEIRRAGPMDKIQSTYECCGEYSSEDYKAIGRQIPDSCYSHPTYNSTVLYKTGCIQAAKENFLSLFNYSSKSEWGSIAFTGLLFIAALYLVIRFRKKQRRYNY